MRKGIQFNTCRILGKYQGGLHSFHPREIDEIHFFHENN